MSNGWSRWVVVALCAVLVSGLAAPRSGRAEDKKPQTVSSEVVKKLKPAQDAVQKSDFDTAITLAREGLAISTKPYDKEMSLRILQFAAAKKQDYTIYAEATEQLNQLEALPAEEKLKNFKALAQIYAQQKNYERSTENASKWAEGGGGFDSYTLLWQLYLMQRDCKNGIVALEKAVEIAARPPSEEELRREYSCYYQLGDKAKRQASLESLVQRFLKKDYYTDLLNLYLEINTDERALLHLYRFGYDRDFLTRESELVEFAASALNSGSPSEAEKIMQKGQSIEAIKFIAASDRNSRLLAHAKQQAAEDRKGIAQFDKEARAGSNGEADVKLGLVYLGFGDPAKAVEAIQRGLTPERVAKVKRLDDARMMLGIAFARLGKKDEATQAFTAAKADPRMAKVAAVYLAAL